MSGARRILFLLGPASLLWRELADQFEAEGHFVRKIHFSLGDQLFWWRRGGVAYRGRRSRFRGFLEAYIREHGITDILYYGDRVFYHVVAQEVARAIGVTAISVENGYLRPDWITLERGGMGVHSHFPADPEVIRQLASRVPEADLAVAFRHSFWHEISLEICYAMISYFWRVFYPFYRFDRYYDPLIEYLAALPHMFGRTARHQAADALVGSLVSQRTPYFVAALQLQGDQQILANSPYKHLSVFIDELIASFATNARPQDLLVFKQHPHDNNREGWGRVVQAAALRHGVEGRVQFIDGGNLDHLLLHARGCLLVNSTVGLLSLRLGCPTKVMGVAVYDMPGLTHQGDLASFWQRPEPVNQTLVADFVRVLAATIQVKGSFFDPKGRAAAAREIVRRVAEGEVNEPGAFVAPPPRLDRARKLGVPVAAGAP